MIYKERNKQPKHNAELPFIRLKSTKGGFFFLVTMTFSNQFAVILLILLSGIREPAGRLEKGAGRTTPGGPCGGSSLLAAENGRRSPNPAENGHFSSKKLVAEKKKTTQICQFLDIF